LFSEKKIATIRLSLESKAKRRNSTMKKFLAVVFALGISAAYAASSYRVTLYKPTNINGTQLKPGDYKLELEGDKVVMKQGKTTVESNVTVQNAPAKFNTTSVGYTADVADKIQEIRIGGTNLKLLFESGSKTAPADGGR
jgi:cytochrome c oxidase assembly protein Cox11